MIDRLLEVQQAVIAICSDKTNKVDGLRHSEWKSLSQIHQLLEPFAVHTTALEANNSTTLSLVLPALFDLQKHLEKMISDGVCKTGAKLLRAELGRRFGHYLDPNKINFDPVFIIATALDPRYKWVLTEEQLQAAKSALLSQLIQIGRAADDVDRDTETDAAPTCSKRFKNLSSSSGSAAVRRTSSIDDEVCSYISNDSQRLDEEADPLEYWSNCALYPNLADIAVDLLSAPCSSSASESLFSHAGFLSSGMKSRISEINLENQVLIKTNYQLLL